MAELNFGLLTPPGSQSIGNAFVSGMDQAAMSRARENQNALSQYQLSAAKRTDQVQNAINNAYQNAINPDGSVNYSKVNAALAAGGAGAKIPEAEAARRKADLDAVELSSRKGTLGLQPTTLAIAQVKLAEGKLKQSRSMLEGINPADSGAAQQYITWHEANHADPVLGPLLAARGVTVEQSRARINAALQQPGGLERLINESKLGVEKFAEMTKPRQPNLATDLVIPDRDGTMVPNTELIGVKKELAAASRPPNTTTHTNVQPDGRGGYVGLNKKTGRMQQIPQDAGVVAGGVLSGAALELAAQGYLMDRRFPTNLGRGKQGAMNTIKIMERAAALASEYGMNAEETAINQIAGRAKSLALANIVKDLAAIRPYNAMLEKNGDIAISLAEKAISTNTKLANRPINWLKQNASDNPDVAEFLAQARIVTTEAARVLNNPRLVGQLTDSARREMEAILNGDMPLESFTRVVRRLQSDGKNRVDAMVAERDSLKQSIRRPNAAGQSTAPAAAMNIPQAAINDLKAGRGTPEQFDEQFGAGAAARVQGAK